MRHRIFLIIFITGILISRILVTSYKGYEYKSDEITGTIYKEVWNKEGQMVLEPEGGLKRILVTGNHLIKYNGKKVTVSGSASILEPARNPGGYSRRDYLYGKNVFWVIEAKNIKVVSDHVFCMRAWGSVFRIHIEDSLKKYMNESELNFLLGVMTGDSAGIEENEKEWIRISGISHLMAVSGMHVTYILMPARYLVRRKSLNIAIRSGLCLMPLFIFIMIAGFTPSVIRATVMCACALIGKIINRKADLLNSLGIAGCVCLLLYPMVVMDIGFILSFGAILSSVVLLKPISKFIFKKKKPGKILNAFCYGSVINIGLLPIMLYNFNMISLIGLLVNIIAAPLSAIMCILGYTTCILGAFPFLKVFAEFTSYILTSVTSLLSLTAKTGALVPVIRTVSPPLWFFIIYYVFLIWIVRGRKHIQIRKIFSLMIIIILSGNLFISNHKNDIEITWFDVGQGSCALIRLRDNTNILIDGGRGYTDVSSLLWKNGISYINWIILSHGDSDHCDGLVKVIKEHHIGGIILSNNPDDEGAEKIALLAKENHIKVKRLDDPAYIFLKQDVKLEIYVNNFAGSLNNSSLVVQLITSDSSVLFPGDMEQKEEELVIKNNFLKQCDIITASHHGAKNGTSKNLLDKTNPVFAIISVGKKNIYGHPSDETLKRFQEKGIYILRTDTDGAVIIKFNNKIIGVETWLKRAKLQYQK